MSQPKARLNAQAMNMVPRLLVSATAPMAVGPTAMPTWTALANMLAANPRFFLGERSDVKATAEG